MTKKEFMNLKVGDKVIIKKYTSSNSIRYGWVSDMNVFIGLTCTISYIDYELEYFKILEDQDGYYFERMAIQEVVTDFAVGREQTSEERIKQLEAEIKDLKEESKKNEIYKSHREAADEMMIFVKAYTDAGFTREEVMNMINNVLSKTKFTVR